MDSLFLIIIAAFSAILGSMGIGGGTILIIYLSGFLGMIQKEAQGLNLLFFIPVAIIALIIHTKSKLIDWKITLFTILPGFLGAYIGFLISTLIDDNLLKKAFAVFLLMIGFHEIFSKNQLKNKNTNSQSF